MNSVVKDFRKIDILINNAGVQFPQESIENISQDQLELTYKVNIFPMFYLTQAALCYMKKGSTIVNTASVTAYQGHVDLIDYSSTIMGAYHAIRFFYFNLLHSNIIISNN